MCLGVYPFVFVPFLLFCTVLCLVSFTCIIVVFSLLFYLVRICLYVHGLSTVECCSFYLCVYLLWCVSLYFSWCVFCLCIFLLFVHSPFLLFYYLSTFYINRNLFLNLGLVAIRWQGLLVGTWHFMHVCACHQGGMGIYFARYILFLDGRFFFLSFLLDCRLHTFLFFFTGLSFILISMSREAPPQ